MNYDTKEVRLVLNGKEHILNGFDADSMIRFPTLWYTVDKEIPYKIKAICKNGKTIDLTFTEEAYAKYIEPLEPSVESPFDYKIIEEPK